VPAFPIVPVYDGRFRIAPIEIVLEDIRRPVAARARHITFGNPDFLNGPRHARDLVRAFGREFPGNTYDVTIKAEHLLAQPAMIPLLHDAGFLFVTSAVPSIDDRVPDAARVGAPALWRPTCMTVSVRSIHRSRGP
jgi:hypothetical protein